MTLSWKSLKGLGNKVSIDPNSVTDRGILKNRITSVVGPHSDLVFLHFFDSEPVRVAGFYDLNFIKEVLGAEALEKLSEAFRKGQ